MTKRNLNLILLIVLIDQLTKYAIKMRFSPGAIVPLTSFFQLTFVTNTGVAFGFLKGANVFFIFFTLLILAVFQYWFAKNSEFLHPGMATAFTFIFGGALGNLVDRIFQGHVIDFLEFHVGRFYWPAFNVADACISIGGTILFFLLFTTKNNSEG